MRAVAALGEALDASPRATGPILVVEGTKVFEGSDDRLSSLFFTLIVLHSLFFKTMALADS